MSVSDRTIVLGLGNLLTGTKVWAFSVSSPCAAGSVRSTASKFWMAAFLDWGFSLWSKARPRFLSWTLSTPESGPGLWSSWPDRISALLAG